MRFVSGRGCKATAEVAVEYTVQPAVALSMLGSMNGRGEADFGSLSCVYFSLPVFLAYTRYILTSSS